MCNWIELMDALDVSPETMDALIKGKVEDASHTSQFIKNFEETY